MALTPIGGQIQAQVINDNFSYLEGLTNKPLGIIDVTKPPYNAKGDGVTDDTNAIMSAVSEAEKKSDGKTKSIVYLPTNGIYKATSSITIDTSKVCVHSDGAEVSFTHTGDGFIVSSSGTSEDAYYTKLSPTIKGLIIRGPGNATSAGAGIKFDDTLSKNCVIDSVYIRGFDKGIEYGSNTWVTSFNHCHISNNNIGFSFPAGLSNAGERITFIDCNFFNQPKMMEVLSPNASIFFMNCSVDYHTGQNFIDVQNSQVWFIGSHIEANADFPWVKVGEGSNVMLTFDDTLFGTTKTYSEAETAEPLIKGSNFKYRSKVILNNVRLLFSNSTIKVLSDDIIGKCHNVVGTEFTSHYGTHYIIDNYNFESGAIGTSAPGWTFSNNGGGGLPEVVDSSTTTPYEGSKCLHIYSSGGWTQYAEQVIHGVEPGDYVDLIAWCKSNGGQKVFQVTVSFLNEKDEVIDSISASSTSTDATWKRYKITPAKIAPIGTQKVKVLLQAGVGWDYFIDSLYIAIN